ncbi:MAG: UDP-N-acetylmuramoyl-L-alanyl-D-glutamate--2,6-diaminopimelate ligase [Clostridia bacterium]|nr:UDP-N-acetylmuramoyl-L-alanyl-D-glutamate--2,6-diaminopimelate ligase [Clostridia bacterium]
MLLSELLRRCGVTSPYTDLRINDVSTDSRDIGTGDLFIALAGEKHDGNDYINEALKKGASAVVSDNISDRSRCIKVTDANVAASYIFSNFYCRPTDSMTFTAITGTNGKSSTVAALSHILSNAGKRVGALGTVEFSVNGCEIDKEEFFGISSSMTTPGVKDFFRALALMRNRGCDFAVAEASSHALAAKRFDGAKIDLGIFTNLTPEHLDRHGDMETYFKAKERLADLSARFLVNSDDGYGRRILESKQGSVGFSAEASCGAMRNLFAVAENIAVNDNGNEYDLRYDGGVVHISTEISGRFALYNTLCAAAAALLLGIPGDIVSGSLAGFSGVKGRMERIVRKEGLPSVIIDYAHTPDAIEKALIEAGRFCRGKLIVVFGCGGDRDREKRAPMCRAACTLADLAIITGDNPRDEDPDRIISDILKGAVGNNYIVERDRETALKLAVERSCENDVILCCGKGHENYIIDKCGKRPFDEKRILLSAVTDKFGAI